MLQSGPLCGSLLSRQDSISKNFDDNRFSAKNILSSGDTAAEHQEQEKRTQTFKLQKANGKKSSVFDEYDQRGNVLADYQDLNDFEHESNQNDLQKDHVLSQIVAQHSGCASPSSHSY